MCENPVACLPVSLTPPSVALGEMGSGLAPALRGAMGAHTASPLRSSILTDSGEAVPNTAAIPICHLVWAAQTGTAAYPYDPTYNTSIANKQHNHIMYWMDSGKNK